MHIYKREDYIERKGGIIIFAIGFRNGDSISVFKNKGTGIICAMKFREARASNYHDVLRPAVFGRIQD